MWAGCGRSRTMSVHGVSGAALPAAFREVVVLCELQELSYTATADILGCPVGTVRSRLHRARVLLAARLAPVRCLADPVIRR